MGYLPHYDRVIPVPSSASPEAVLAKPRPASRGGDGWAAARVFATANGTATTFIVDTAAVGAVEYSDFEAAALLTTDRFTGSMLVLGGRSVYITDHTFAVNTATFTFIPLPDEGPVPLTATDIGSPALIRADIPLTVSQILIKTAGNGLHVNTRAAGMIAAGEFITLLNGESFMVADTESGYPGRTVYLRNSAAAPGVAEVHVMVP